MSSTQSSTPPSWRRTIDSSGYFTLAFGSIVGSGWVLVLGDWLTAAGPGGSMLGFAAGGTVMLLVAMCYAELASRMPRAGGEFVYALEILGPKWAFGVSWFLTLYFAAFTAFEGIALAWVLETLFPSLRGPVVYNLFGEDLTLGALIIGVAGALAFAWLNCIGTAVAIGFQRMVTFGFIFLVVCLMLAGFTHGEAANAQPMFASLGSSHWSHGALWIFATTAVFLNGFQAATYSIEERSPSTTITGVITPMVLGVLAAIAFYCGIILAASFSAPWQEFVQSPLPAAAAFGELTASGAMSKIVLTGAAISLLKSWNAYVLSAARLIYAQADRHFLPASLGKIHPESSTPVVAVGMVLVLNIIGVFLGRGAIIPILNMCAICLACSFVLNLNVLLKARKKDPAYKGFRVPGGTNTVLFAMSGTIIMAATAIYEPLTRSTTAIPVEWVLIIIWGGIATISWHFTRNMRSRSEKPEGEAEK